MAHRWQVSRWERQWVGERSSGARPLGRFACKEWRDLLHWRIGGRCVGGDVSHVATAHKQCIRGRCHVRKRDLLHWRIGGRCHARKRDLLHDKTKKPGHRVARLWSAHQDAKVSMSYSGKRTTPCCFTPSIMTVRGFSKRTWRTWAVSSTAGIASSTALLKSPS